MNIKISRVTQEEQIQFVAENFEKTISLWEDYAVNEEKISNRKDEIRKWLSNDQLYLATASIDSKIVGFNSLSIIKDYSQNPIGKVIILFVDESYRNRGIAKILKEAGTKWLHSFGVKKVLTEIDAKNTRMLEINKTAGFSIKSYIYEKEI